MRNVIVLILSALALLSVSAHAEQMCGARPCWQVNVDWSIGDRGFVEPVIQREWKEVLGPRYSVNLWHIAIEAPGARGRATVAALAIDAAKNHFDQKAWEYMISTQLHNQPAAQTIREAGVWKIAEYLRSK